MVQIKSITNGTNKAKNIKFDFSVMKDRKSLIKPYNLEPFTTGTLLLSIFTW